LHLFFVGISRPKEDFKRSMKTKLSKILGIGFALILVASLMLFALPAAAGPYEDLEPPLPNMWTGFAPTEGVMGLWFNDPDINKVGPIAQAINGDIYAYVSNADGAGSHDIFKSVNDGRTWSVSTIPAYYTGGAVVDMVCSSKSEDVIYLTDGNYVYKSINGALSFTLVAQSDLENQLVGACGTAITLLPITCIDVGYDGAGKPIVLIGTRNVGVIYPAGHPLNPDPIVGSVYYIADETFSASWTDLDLSCYTCCVPATGVGCYDVYSVAAAPGFDSVSKVYATITAPLTSINYTAATAVVEVRAGDYGANFTFTTVAGVTPTGATVDLTANQVYTFTATAATGTSTITLNDGTISWRVVSGSGVTFCGGTHVLSTLGTVCAWTHIHEIAWNCMYSFEIEHASRMMFPSYYASEAAMFVGVAAVNDQSGTATLNGWGEGGDVYRVTDAGPLSDCIDLNIQGFTTGCTGFNHANICSLDIDTNDALTAGAWNAYQLQSPTRVYYSADGGWTWAKSKKDPTGLDQTYVLFAGGSIVAATNGCDCAFSMSCGANLGDYFNQISLISRDVEEVLDMTHAPGYVFDSQIMYVLTWDQSVCGGANDIVSLLRWDGTYWERVFSSRYYIVASTQGTSGFAYAPLYEWVEVSPDFNSTDCIYMANSDFYLTRSIDAGCSWAPLVYPCFDRPTITAWIVVDEDTVLAAGGGSSSGHVYRTTNHGAQPWSSFTVRNTATALAGDGVDFDLSLPRAADSDVLLGDDVGQVFLSQDLGETWVEIADAATGSFGAQYNTYVVFDPGYGTAGDPGENTFYAAAGTDIGRCAYNAAALPFKQNWVYICPAAATCDTCALYLASGIDAVGDTVLYVADAGAPASGSSGATVSGTIAVSYTCGGGYTDVCTCDVTISGLELDILDGTIANNEPVTIIDYNLFCTAGGGIDGDFLVMGLINGGLGSVVIGDPIALAGTCTDCGPLSSAYAVISSSLTATVTSVTAAHPTGVWRSVNPLDPMPPLYPALVEWEFLQAGLRPTSILHPWSGYALGNYYGVWPDDLWLTAASNMLWAIEDDGIRVECPTDYIWMWEDPLATQVIQVSPADGALLATETSATLEWEALDGATLYEVKVYVECPECLNPLEMKDFTTETTAATCITITGMTPGKTYFWKVRVACDSPQVSKWSDIRSFDTALSATIFCSPECGAENITLTPNFSWSAVVGATSYEIEVSLTEDFASVLASGTPTINAWDGVPELDYATTYYWRVRAAQGSVYSGWTYCLFSTIDEPIPPAEPVEPVDVTINEITPTWIWVIIGIGGALTIVVIILIVTTRRVP
jgi:hypothetical protein